MNFLFCIASAYANFDLSNPTVTLRMIVWGAVIGVAVGAAISVFHRRSLGTFVRAIKRAGAETPETAQTLAQLGLQKSPLLRAALRAGKPMRRYACAVGEETLPEGTPAEGRAMSGVRRALSLPEAERTITDTRTARFYIPREEMYTAEIRYNMKGTHIPALIVAIVILVVLGFFAEAMIPELLTMTDNFLTQVNGG